MLIAGFSSKLIARALRISEPTVRKHRENLLTKLGCRHTGQLARLWLRRAVNTTTEP
jgi:DNA-binding CsgD family transcriptional regulator